MKFKLRKKYLKILIPIVLMCIISAGSFLIINGRKRTFSSKLIAGAVEIYRTNEEIIDKTYNENDFTSKFLEQGELAVSVKGFGEKKEMNIQSDTTSSNQIIDNNLNKRISADKIAKLDQSISFLTESIDNNPFLSQTDLKISGLEAGEILKK